MKFILPWILLLSSLAPAYAEHPPAVRAIVGEAEDQGIRCNAFKWVDAPQSTVINLCVCNSRGAI